MKQKRKVKSLISSTDGKNLFLTGLLFLLGGILCFGAVSLFTSSVGVEAAGAESINYPGIADKHEVLLKFGLIPQSENNPINEMYLSENTFFMSGNDGISVDISNTNRTDKYINYLGGEVGMNVGSNNITIIGGSNDTVNPDNDDATVLGGKGNIIDRGNNKAAPVILGGQKEDEDIKTIGKNQEGSAVVGGEDNTILDNGSYDFILGGQNNKIKGDHVIVGGAKVNVNDKSNLFVFSYGSHAGSFDPQGGDAFYLNLKKGLGLNEEAANEGVGSKGAVSFGEIDITTQTCTSADAGVQGTWEGCLVGCTQKYASDGTNWKWEMIDHGTGCEALCNGNSHCAVDPFKNNVTPYTSYCTTNGVDTGHSHHCGGEENILNQYKNVLFETKLIDSDAKCPDPTDPTNWTENRCVFKCDEDYHLTGADANGNGGKCYKDCELPWDHTKIKHNETKIAYKALDAYCSNSAGTHKNCSDYKATLVCDNGTLRVKSSKTPSEKDKEATSLGYQYSGCMLHQYTCPATYNYTKTQIGSVFSDAPKNGSWRINDRSTIQGNRGKYKLCVDYKTQGNGIQYQNGETCLEQYKNGDNSYEKHYQWLGCQDHYHTGARSNYVCMKDCTLKNTNGTTKYYLHTETVTAYENNVVECTSAGNGKCKSATLVCNDGTWMKNGSPTSAYPYNNCSLSDWDCDTNEFNITQDTKTANEPYSIYGSSCVSYKGESDKITCSVKSTDYKLTSCLNWNQPSGYHTEDNMVCVSNKDDRNCTHAGASVTNHFHYINKLVPVTWGGTAYNNGSWSTPANCEWECDSTFHLENGDCISNSRDVNCSDYYTLPSNATWNRLGYQTWNVSQNKWNSPQFCSWSCNSGWHKNSAGTACEKDCTVVSCSDYTLDECPEHGHCSYCTKVDASCNDGVTKAKLDYCDTDWDVSGDTCVYNPSCDVNYCSAYGLDECPAHGICSYCTIKYSDCTNGAQKAKLTGCEGEYQLNADGTACEEPDGGRPGGGDDGDDGDDDGDDDDNDCSAETYTYGDCSYSIPALSDGGSQTVSTSTSSRNGSVKVTCSNGTLSYSNKSCKKSTSCGTAPTNSSWVVSTYAQSWNGSAWSPSSKSKTCVTSSSSTTECSFKCNNGKVCNGNSGCKDPDDDNPGDEGGFDNDCSATTHTYGSCSFSIPALGNGESTVAQHTTSPYYGITTAKCTNGSLSYSSESCITVCNSSTNPGSCNGSFSPTYGGVQTYLSSYSYTCGSYSCSATCPSGTYWFGYSCSDPNGICATTHNGCTNSASLVSGSPSSKTSGTTTTYTWSCKRGDYTEDCTETETITESCPDGYWELWTSNTVEEIIGHECGQSGTDGWELQYNGTANGNSCVKCRAKSCPTGSSTTCNGARVGYAGDDPCYSCEPNYTIVNGTSLDGELCTRTMGFITPIDLVPSGWPLTEDEACAAYYADPRGTDCHNDYYGGYVGDSQIYYCPSISISSCGTTDYQQYCSNNSQGMCYISDTQDSCTETTLLRYTSLCGGNCSANPDTGVILTEKRCKGSMQYVKCK